jgi:mRNA interferase MazF
MRGGIMYDQRDIVLIPFPYTDLTGSKKRPALIISNINLNKTEDRICCLVTSNIHKENIKVENSNLEEGILPFKSSIKAYRIFTIDKNIIIKKLCIVKEDFHNKIIEEVNKYIKSQN